MAKEEENYITIVNLKEENGRLQRQIKQDKQGTKNGASDRELAKLSVENEFLRKQIEDLRMNQSQNNISVSDQKP